MKQEWFEEWFDTKYYHILYKNRDFKEARQFIDNLMGHLAPDKKSKFLDLACGKGRFSLYLAEKGYDLTGVDLSQESIEYAKQFERKSLKFFMHDMRLPFKIAHFDYIFNFFTSFGYFETDEAHQETLSNVVKGLVNNGVFVLDFLNAEKLIDGLKKREQKTIDGITFKIRRKVMDGFIIKTIRFKDQGKEFKFREKVRAYTIDDFQELFEKAGLVVNELFGSYQLAPFDKRTSDRLIIMAKKK